MKYLRELKKNKKCHPDPLQKVQKDPFYGSCSGEREHISENKSASCDGLDLEAETTPAYREGPPYPDGQAG